MLGFVSVNVNIPMPTMLVGLGILVIIYFLR
jgi:hypothetical protein